MKKIHKKDTICAIATGSGSGAISIIRLSGKDSFEICNKIFSKDITNEKSHTVHFGTIKKENKIIAHIAVLVTLIALLGLTMPLKAAIADGRTLSIIRVAAMLLTGSLAMISFIRSFIAARKKS